jgi:GTP-binding protein
MLPVLALVGRPNVGKSTLFNRLTRTRNALVADVPGLTRDRQYGAGRVNGREFLVVDTGGLTGAGDGIEGLIARQVWQAIDEADAVLFLVDGRAGMSAADEEIAGQLRRSGKALFLVINKTEHLDLHTAGAEFHALGLGPPAAVSAAHGRGVEALIRTVLEALPRDKEIDGSEASDAGTNCIRLTVVGRPNVGKSTLANRLLGEERMLTYDMPGTTRDSVEAAFERGGQRFTLIDTAGVRRRSRVSEAIEKFSVIKTLQAVERAHVVVLLLDARQGIGEQDATLLGYVLDSGRALVVAVNKWDHLDVEVRQRVRQDVTRKLRFLDFARVHFVSALYGSGIGDVLASVRKAYKAATRKLSTPELTRILEGAVAGHQPPLVHGHRIKLRFAHQGGQNPPLIVIHGNRVDHVPEAYRRYLINVYRRALRLEGTPVRIDFKSGDNPYAPSKSRRDPVKGQAKGRRRS